MSGTGFTPDPNADFSGDGGWDVLAGEYVLGLMDEPAARSLRQRAQATPALAAAIAAWEHRLDPLADLAAPVAPSEVLWSRIARDIGPAAAGHEPAGTVVPLNTPGTFWRSVALGSMAVAAGLAICLLWSANEKHPAMWPQAAALLAPPGGVAPALRAQITAAGAITVVPLRHLDVASGQALGFWAWPAGEKAPIFLGRLNPSGGQMAFPFPAREGTPVMVTLEHPGTAAVTTPGPTLYLGLLVGHPG